MEWKFRDMDLMLSIMVVFKGQCENQEASKDIAEKEPVDVK